MTALSSRRQAIEMIFGGNKMGWEWEIRVNTKVRLGSCEF